MWLGDVAPVSSTVDFLYLRPARSGSSLPPVLVALSPARLTGAAMSLRLLLKEKLPAGWPFLKQHISAVVSQRCYAFDARFKRSLEPLNAAALTTKSRHPRHSMLLLLMATWRSAHAYIQGHGQSTGKTMGSASYHSWAQCYFSLLFIRGRTTMRLALLHTQTLRVIHRHKFT